MPDFSHLYRRPAGRTPKPALLPIETYPGVVKSFEFIERDRQGAKVAAVRFHLALTGWPDGVPESSRTQEGADGSMAPINLGSRQFRRDMDTPEDFNDRAWYYMDELLRSFGLDPDERSYEELFPQTIGQPCLVSISQYLNPNTSDTSNVVQSFVGLNRD